MIPHFLVDRPELHPNSFDQPASVNQCGRFSFHDESPVVIRNPYQPTCVRRVLESNANQQLRRLIDLECRKTPANTDEASGIMRPARTKSKPPAQELPQSTG
jgi:hypothetical protein